MQGLGEQSFAATMHAFLKIGSLSESDLMATCSAKANNEASAFPLVSTNWESSSFCFSVQQ